MTDKIQFTVKVLDWALNYSKFNKNSWGEFAKYSIIFNDREDAINGLLSAEEIQLFSKNVALPYGFLFLNEIPSDYVMPNKNYKHVKKAGKFILINDEQAIRLKDIISVRRLTSIGIIEVKARKEVYEFLLFQSGGDDLFDELVSILGF